MNTNSGYTNIISAPDLQARLDNPDWVIVDCRFDLSQPGWGFQDYLYGHIPGAVYAHLDYDLSGPRTTLNGRHPLPDNEAFRASMGRFGIDRSKQVVVYDTT
ncbi:sulfurtransferase, partial [bacterium]|nr:sulfurtransferase [bacterium]